MEIVAWQQFWIVVFPIFAIVKSVFYKTGPEHLTTLHKLLLYTVHFLNACFEGIHPATDPYSQPWPANSPDAVLAGQRMCGGLRFVVWHIVSDMECLSNDCGWPHFNNLQPCIFDSVSTEQGSDYPMTDLSRDANWLDTLLSDDELIHISPTNSPLQFLHGLTRFHTPGELMHAGCLGTVQFLIGSIFSELILFGPFVGDKAARTAQLWSVIQRHYDAMSTPSRLSKLEPAQFLKEGWANFSAKAMDSQQLLFVLEPVLAELNNGSDRMLHQIFAVHHLASMYRIFKAHGMFLPEAASSEAFWHCQEFLEEYSWLLHDALDRGLQFYPPHVKVHAMYHIAFFSRYFNPRFGWAYEGEDFMNTIVTSGKACVAGTPMQLIGNKVMENFRLTLHLLLSRQCQDEA